MSQRSEFCKRLHYLNCGDWVESCTALVEHHDGRLELIDWAALNRLSFYAPRQEGIPHAA